MINVDEVNDAQMGSMAAAIAAERIAILLGKYVCEEVGLFEFVRQNPDILERKLIDGKNLLHLAVQADDLGLVQKILDGGFVKVSLNVLSRQRRIRNFNFSVSLSFHYPHDLL
jgi:hypothetical protein